MAFPSPNGAAVAVRNPSGLRIRKTYQEHGARRRHVVDRMPAGSSNGWQFHAACRGEDSALFFAPSYFERREEKAAREAHYITGTAHPDPGWDGKLSISEMQGGTFTISNGGVYGSMLSTPILNAPQAGILGMHRIEERPVVKNGQIVARPMMYLALSYDHRLVDGKEAVTFLVRVKECLEDPQRFILEL